MTIKRVIILFVTVAVLICLLVLSLIWVSGRRTERSVTELKTNNITQPDSSTTTSVEALQPGNFLHTGSSTYVINLFDYSTNTTDVGAWVLPKSIAQQVIKEKSCKPLEQEEAVIYLPVSFQDAYRCKITPLNANRVAIAVTGLAFPYEGLPSISNMIMMLEDQGMVIYQNTKGQFTLEKQAAQQALKAYTTQHGEFEFGGPGWKEGLNYLRNFLSERIENPSQEILQAEAGLQAKHLRIMTLTKRKL